MTVIEHGQEHYPCLYIDHPRFSLLLDLIERLQREGRFGLEASKALWFVLGLLLKLPETIGNPFTIVEKRNNVGDKASADQRFILAWLLAYSSCENGCT